MADKCWKLTFTGSKWHNILQKDQHLKNFVHSNTVNLGDIEKQGSLDIFEGKGFESKGSMNFEFRGRARFVKPPTIAAQEAFGPPQRAEERPERIAGPQPDHIPPEGHIEFLYRLWGKQEPKPVIHYLERSIQPLKPLKKQTTEAAKLEVRNNENLYKINHARGSKTTKSYNYIIRMAEARFVCQKPAKPLALIQAERGTDESRSPEKRVLYKEPSFLPFASKEVSTQVIQFKPENVGHHHCHRLGTHEIEEKRARVLRKAQTGTFVRK